MKLLLENWRQYLNESENSSHYGDLYLFENDTVTKTSFYDALNTLSESDNDVDAFLENWEHSVSYMFESLDEAAGVPIETGIESIDDAILKASTQAWMIQNKFKEKAVNKVLSVSKKINDFADKNPKTVKVAKVVVGGLLAAAAVYGISQILQSGGDASDVMELAQTIQPEDPSLAQDLAECAQEFSAEKVVEFAQEQTDVVEKVADTLSAAGEPALEKVGEVADNVAQDMSVGDFWNDAFEKFDANQGQWKGDVGFFADAEPVKDAVTQGSIDWVDWMPTDVTDVESYMEYGPYGEDLVANMPEGDAKQNALELAAEQWAEYKEMAETFKSGGSLEDLNMTKQDFNRFAGDAVYAPRRPDSIVRNIGKLGREMGDSMFSSGLDAGSGTAVNAGTGHIPPNYMKWLRKAMRASLK